MIGRAELRRHDDGTVTVDRADDLIAVASELLDHGPEGYRSPFLTLDSAGEYVYRRVSEAHGVVVFERVRD